MTDIFELIIKRNGSKESKIKAQKITDLKNGFDLFLKKEGAVIKRKKK